MKFNPLTNVIFTDTGLVLKKLTCPWEARWEEKFPEKRARVCAQCNKTVYDTAGMTDEEIMELLKKDPKACIQISNDQGNVHLALSDDPCIEDL